MAVKIALGAALAAADRGAPDETVWHCERAKAACVELAAPSAPPPVEADEPLGIEAVMVLTGYSKSTLRRRGHTFPGYHKYPDGKVIWWKRKLVAWLHSSP